MRSGFGDFSMINLKDIKSHPVLKKIDATLNLIENGDQVSSIKDLFRLDEEMRLELLHHTLHYVFQAIPYYKNIVGNSSDIERLFGQLPIMNRTTINLEHDKFINPHIFPDGIKCTSGTTDLKKRMIIPQHNLEGDLCSKLYRLYSYIKKTSNSADQKKELCLRLIPAMRRLIATGGVNKNQGQIPLVAMIDYDFPKYRTQSDYYDYIVQLLNAEYPLHGMENRISSIHVTPPFLIDLLTREFIDRGISPAMFGIKKITCTGGVSSKKFRKFLEKNWDSSVLSTFSHTEANTSYFECPKHTHRYHSYIGVYIEILSEENKPVDEYCEGRLIITTLFPFQFIHPFIRYEMGDIVRKIPEKCDCGFKGQSIEWIGRKNHCIAMKNISREYDDFYLGTIDVYEAIGEDLNSIVQLPFPKFRLDIGGSGQIVLSIEVNIMEDEPTMNLKKKTLRTNILDAVRKRIEKKEQKVEPKIAVDIDFYEKGFLKDAYFIGT